MDWVLILLGWAIWLARKEMAKNTKQEKKGI